MVGDVTNNTRTVNCTNVIFLGHSVALRLIPSTSNLGAALMSRKQELTGQNCVLFDFDLLAVIITSRKKLV